MKGFTIDFERCGKLLQKRKRIMHTEYNEQDWAALCATTDTLFDEFGSRPRAFAEAVRRNPGLSATPPTTSQALATPTPGDPLGRAIERLSATLAPQEVSGPEGSLIVKACEASAARMRVSKEAPDTTPADPLMRAVDRLGGK